MGEGVEGKWGGGCKQMIVDGTKLLRFESFFRWLRLNMKQIVKLPQTSVPVALTVRKKLSRYGQLPTSELAPQTCDEEAGDWLSYLSLQLAELHEMLRDRKRLLIIHS